MLFKGGFISLVVVLVVAWGGIHAFPHVQAKRTPQYSQDSTYEHSYKQQDGGFKRPVMGTYEMVRRGATECGLDDNIWADYNEALNQLLWNVAVGNIPLEELFDICSDHVDQFFTEVEDSVNSGDESICNCGLNRYKEVVKLLNDKEEFAAGDCNALVSRFEEKKICTDQAIVNCSNIVHEAFTAGSNHDAQTIIDQARDCLIELLLSSPQWTDECARIMDYEEVTTQYIESFHTLMTMKVQGCNIREVIDDCCPPFQYTCTLNMADRMEVYEDVLDCYNQHHHQHNTIKKCEIAEHSQISEILITEWDEIEQNKCPDTPELEAFWARIGCTNIPPWRPESVGFSSPDYAKKSSNDLTELLDMKKRILGETNQN